MVLEVSSFQLETIQTFRPKIAVVLNITPDHLDRHRTFAAYTDAKARIFENQQAEDFAVLNADDAASAGLAGRTRSQVFWFSRKQEVKQGAYVRDGRVLFRDQGGQREVMLVSEIPLKGAHNVENALAAVCVGALMGCDTEHIRTAVRNFKAVEHRLEYVATIRGVEYYNDSKATNVDATIKALESFSANVHLILGGKDKDSDYTLLNDLLRQRVKRVYTIGAAAERSNRRLKVSRWITRRPWKRRSDTPRALPSRRYCAAGPSVRQLRSVSELRAPRKGLQGEVRALAGAGTPTEAQSTERKVVVQPFLKIHRHCSPRPFLSVVK